MKNYKNIFVSFLTCILTVMLVHGSHTIYADSAQDSAAEFDEWLTKISDTSSGPSFSEEVDFQQTLNSLGSGSVGVSRALYHAYMNRFFNDKFALLNDALENTTNFHDIDESPNFQPPQDNFAPERQRLDTVVEKCGPENVSTVCVSMRATVVYLIYVQHLESVRNSLSAGMSETYSNVINNLSGRAAEVTEEIEDARQALEGTLAAYNEYRIAYPVHQKYQEIYKSLVVYKNELEEVTAGAAQYPGKFVDVSSDQCQ